MIKPISREQDNAIWEDFAQRWTLSAHQLAQFRHYYTAVRKANELFNITSIDSLNSFIRYHFEDSLFLERAIPLEQVNSLADVGTGGGFPGLPLKIKYPHLKIILIEVSLKKAAFLQKIAQELGLENVEVCTLDWRTFLRTTQGTIDLFCARASLQPEELMRMFQPSSAYKNAQLVYWASATWQPGKKEAPFLEKEFAYHVGNKRRRLIIFANAAVTHQ